MKRPQYGDGRLVALDGRYESVDVLLETPSGEHWHVATFWHMHGGIPLPRESADWFVAAWRNAETVAELQARVERLEKANRDLERDLEAYRRADSEAAGDVGMEEALARLVRMEDGDYQPGDPVRTLSGHGMSWTGTVVRVNETTYTVDRSDGKRVRWSRESTYPHPSIWDDARAVLAGRRP